MRLSLLVLLLALASTPEAQPPAFGSADDVMELGAGPTSPDRVQASLWAGPTFVRAGWRTGLRAEASMLRGRFSASIGESLHPGAGGLYPTEADDLYDVLRTIRYVRVQPREEQKGIYARLGPLENATLGTGLIARRYNTTAAWDERRIGIEAAIEGKTVQASAFAADIVGSGVAGAQIETQTSMGVGPVRDLRLGLAAVHDLSLPLQGDSSLTGAEVTLSGDLFAEGGLRLSPWVSYAQYLGKGGGIGTGLALEGIELGGVARAHARLGLVVARGRFSPGWVGPFYSVNGGRQRIIAANSFYDADPDVLLAGTSIDSLRGGIDVTTDLRAVAFGRVEAMLYARRHFGPRPLSAFSLRIAARAGTTRFELGLEKQGFRSLLSLFGGDLGEQNTLVLDIGVPIRALSGTHVYVRSRYGYRRLPDAEAAPDRFLVERRFEPFIGIRTRW